MNLRRPKVALKAGFSAAVMKDVRRIETLWSQCRRLHGKGDGTGGEQANAGGKGVHEGIRLVVVGPVA